MATDPRTRLPRRKQRCPSFETLIAYAVGTATPQTQKDIEAHLTDCEHCQNGLREYRSIEQTIASGTLVPLPAELRDRVERRAKFAGKSKRNLQAARKDAPPRRS